MGFTTGFTGGVTLVLGTAYLTLQAHQRIRQHQAETLRAQTHVLQSLSYIPASAPRPSTVAEELALLEHQQELLAQRHHRRAERHSGPSDNFLDRAKARWNSEVEGAVRWAASTDWVAAREDAEDTLLRVWARATGGEAPAQTAERAVAAARSGAESAVVEARGVVESTAAEAREAGVDMWERGLRKGKELAEQAKTAAGVAEEKAQEKVAFVGKAVAEADAEKIIERRYRRPEEMLSPSAEELLEERYRPVV